MKVSLIERYALHLPVGLVIGVIEALPDAAERGERELARVVERVEMQLRTAKVVGQFSAPRLRRLVADHLEGRLEQMRAPSSPSSPSSPTEESMVPSDAEGAPSTTEPSPDSRRDGSRRDGPRRDGSRRDGPRRDAARPTERSSTTSSVAAADLPIDGYDQLSASQIVSSLAGLSIADLEVLRRHETEGRQRRTVLTRIGQLLGEGH